MQISTGLFGDGAAPESSAGPRIDLDRSAPALKPCRFCGSAVGVLTGPKGPHRDGVRCAECDRHLGWLPALPDDCALIEN